MHLGIVTLSYNQQAFLEQAITSVRLSDRHTLEYVVVDPGSTDASRHIIERYRGCITDSVFEPDDGPADGLNKGFSRLRKAEVCGYLNADDRFLPGALDHVCDFFKSHQDCDLLFGSIHIIDRAGNRKLRGRHVERVSPVRYAERTCRIWQQATFFRRSAYEAIRGFNPLNRISWDTELVVDMLLAGARPKYTRRPLGEFRVYEDSLTGSQKHRKLASSEHYRIADKVYSAGQYRPRPLFLSDLSRAAYRVSPLRQLSNLWVGLHR